MKRLPFFAAMLLSACAAGPAPVTAPDAQIAAAAAAQAGLAQMAGHVDLQSFMGHWYVIANIADGEEADKVAAQLDYLLEGDGRIAQRYTARESDFIHQPQTSESTARVADSSSNAHWKVRRGWSLGPDYLILYVDPQYRYAVAGSLERDRAWILSREARMTDELYQRLHLVLEARGYDSSHLLKVPQVEDQVGAPGYR